jgi:putative endonuclease
MRPGDWQLRSRTLTRTELGRLAELAVADYLFARGYTLIARNVRLGPLELDLVARKGALAVIVEVRTRRPGAMVRAFESVTPAKRARVMRGAQRLWRERLAKMVGVERLRIDVAAVAFIDGVTRVEYVPGAISGWVS